jgi:hypothetical protein
MSCPKVSAIISAYYAAPYLRGRLDNLCDLSLTPEIIVICQAESDEYNIVKGWKPAVDLIITTLGVPTIYASWNTGIEAAHGEYIANANSDDLYTINALRDMAHVLDLHPDCAVVYGDHLKSVEYKGKPISRANRSSGGFEELKKRYFVGPMPMWRKSLHDKYGLFDPEMRVSGDYEFFLRIAAHGEKFFYLDEIVGTYLWRKNSAEHSNPIAMKYEDQLIRERYGKAVRA